MGPGYRPQPLFILPYVFTSRRLDVHTSLLPGVQTSMRLGDNMSVHLYFYTSLLLGTQTSTLLYVCTSILLYVYTYSLLSIQTSTLLYVYTSICLRFYASSLPGAQTSKNIFLKLFTFYKTWCIRARAHIQQKKFLLQSEMFCYNPLQ